MTTVVLASASPRRRALLEAAGLQVEVRAAELAEDSWPGEDPVSRARRLAEAKARAVAARVPPDQAVLGADTVVALDGVCRGKPVDAADAERTLRALSGRWHSVTTGYCVVLGQEIRRGHVTTRVSFRPLTEGVIRRYVASAEPLDKAGAYGIQGLGSALVDRVDGSWSNVVGLPLAQVLALLADLGVAPGEE
ncbi:MAG: septum formation protein Maf [Deltaproteobacteria bacterium]|nr:septum formation protein Maf [Deltaproteobacteria bacterium]